MSSLEEIAKKRGITLEDAPTALEAAAQSRGIETGVEYGTLLPVRHDEQGMHFDSDAGVLGAAKRAVMLPGQVLKGDVDPMSEEGRNRAMEMAAFATPGSVASRSGVGFAGAPITKQVRTAAPSTLALRETADAQFDAM